MLLNNRRHKILKVRFDFLPRIFVAGHFEIVVNDVTIVIQLTIRHMFVQEWLIEHAAAKFAQFTFVRDKLWPW